MTVVLDAGGVSALAGERERLRELRSRGQWPPVVPTVVLTEALTGDHRRDFHEDRLLRSCDLVEIDEDIARAAARLRTSSARPTSAVDALVVAVADERGGAVVLTSDPEDLRSLAAHATSPVRIERA